MQEQEQVRMVFREKCLEASQESVSPEEAAQIRGAMKEPWFQKVCGLALQEVEGLMLTTTNMDFSQVPQSNVVASRHQGMCSGMARVLDIFLESSNDHPSS